MYTSFTNIEDQLHSTYMNITHTQLNLKGMENLIPDYNVPPLCPMTGMKRSYYNACRPDMMMTDDVIRSRDENFIRPITYEKVFDYQKANMLDTPLGEPILSKASHNVLERQRRNDLKLRFNILRDNIPEIINNDKVAKITILKKALDYIEQLKSQEQKLLVDLELERQRKIILSTRLKQLQGSY